MKKRKLILHCSDSAIPSHDVDVIRKWHTDPKDMGGRGWSDIGYHYIIERKTGSFQVGRDFSRKGAHTSGQNTEIGLCMCGKSGMFTQAQMKTLEQFIMLYSGMISEIKQHSDFDKRKSFCAGFTESQMEYLNGLLK